MFFNPTKRLVRLLRQASWQLKGHGEKQYLGDFETCQELAEFIEQSAAQLAQGDRRSLNRLWFLFAPTCDWDDAGGSLDIGNKVFALIDRLR